MAYRNTRFRRRRNVRTRPRRYNKTRSVVTRPNPMKIRPIRSYIKYNIHKFKRSCLKLSNASTNTSSGGLNIALTFALTDLPSVNEFTTLYDMFKITGIKLSIIWRSSNLSMIETNNTQGVGMPYMYYAVDRDDATSTSITDLREFSKAKRFEFDTGKRVCHIFFKPNTLSENYLTGVTTGYTINYNKWVDMAQSGMPFWGFKAAIQVPLNAPSVAAYFDVEATYYLAMKDPR